MKAMNFSWWCRIVLLNFSLFVSDSQQATNVCVEYISLLLHCCCAKQCFMNKKINIFQSNFASFFRFFIDSEIFFALFSIKQTYKDLRVQRSIDCTPENVSYPVYGSDMNIISMNGTIIFTGKVDITEDLPMNIELEMALTRCNVDKTGCINFDKVIFSRICEKMETKTSVAYNLVRGVVPVPKCPIKKGHYDIKNDSQMSMEIFKLIPLEGFLWKSKYLFYEKRGTKRFRPLACVEYDAVVVKKIRRKSSRN